VICWTQSFYGGVKSDHLRGDGVTGFVSIEPTKHLKSILDDVQQPWGIRMCPCCGQSHTIRIQGKIRDGINGRFTKNDLPAFVIFYIETAQVFSGTGSQSVPGPVGRSPDFRPDDDFSFSKE